MKNKLKIFLPILLVSSSSFVLFQVGKNLPVFQNSNQNSNSVNLTDKTVISTNFQKLSVLENRCRGCGKCMRIDPVHFEIVNSVAKIISSTNLSSKNLIMAINACPDQAITLS